MGKSGARRKVARQEMFKLSETHVLGNLRCYLFVNFHNTYEKCFHKCPLFFSIHFPFSFRYQDSKM